MKLKNWFLSGILFTSVIVHLSFTSKQNTSSGIDLSNIEALSSVEYDPNCIGIGSVDCPTSATKVELIIYF